MTTRSLLVLEKEVGSLCENAIDEGRDFLNDVEMQYLLKMTEDVFAKIKTSVSK